MFSRNSCKLWCHGLEMIDSQVTLWVMLLWGEHDREKPDSRLKRHIESKAENMEEWPFSWQMVWLSLFSRRSWSHSVYPGYCSQVRQEHIAASSAGETQWFLIPTTKFLCWGKTGQFKNGRALIYILILAVVSTKVLINSLYDLFNSCIGHLLYTRYLGRCFMIRVVFPYIVVCCCWRKRRRKKNTL